MPTPRATPRRAARSSKRSSRQRGPPASSCGGSAAWNDESPLAPPNHRRPGPLSRAGTTSTEPALDRRGTTEEGTMDDQDDRDPSEMLIDDEDAPQPEVARIRRKVRSAGRDGRVRSKTIAP